MYALLPGKPQESLDTSVCSTFKTHGLVLISLYPPQDPTHAAHSPVPAQLTPALPLSSDTVLVCSGFHNTQFYSFKPAQSLSMCRPLTPEGLPRPLQRTCKVKTIFALVPDQYLTSHTVLTCALMTPKHKWIKLLAPWHKSRQQHQILTATVIVTAMHWQKGGQFHLRMALMKQ